MENPYVSIVGKNTQTNTSQPIENLKNAGRRGASKQALAKYDRIKANMQKEKFVLNHERRLVRRKENLREVISLYRERSPLQDDLITIILLYAGMIFIGKYSICWVQFV